MADPAAILARLRANGADIVLAGGKMTLVGGGRLTVEARAFVAQHREAIADHLREALEDATEERAAIIEFEGGAPREWAEQFAKILIGARPAGVDDLDWTDFIIAAGRIVDEAPATRRAAA